MRAIRVFVFGLLVAVAGVGVVSESVPSADAATIFVPCNTASLVNAVETANSQPGSDILELAAGCQYVLTGPYGGSFGTTGLPGIESDITINGNGAIIARDLSALRFRIFWVDSGGALTLYGVNVVGGRALEGQASFGGTNGQNGGAAYVEGTLTVWNSMITGNSAGQGWSYDGIGSDPVQAGGPGGNGGAIYLASAGSSATISSSTLEGNRAGNGGNGAPGHSAGLGGSGGAIYVAQGQATVVNTTINRNFGGDAGTSPSAAQGGRGGGIFVFSGANATITNTTISGNTAGAGSPAGTGGGIYEFGVTVVKNTIVANSTSGGDCISFFEEGSTTNLASDSTCTCSVVGCFTQKTSTEINLGELANNGGPTPTMALNYPSAAIDAGNNAVCAAAPVNNVDQRGVPRPFDRDNNGTAICDIGAYEEATPPPPNDKLADAASFTVPTSESGIANTGVTSGATIEPGENVPSCQSSFSASVWFTWTAPPTGPIVLDTFGTSFDTVLAVYTGASFPLTEVACNDNFHSPNSAVQLWFTPNTTYRIQLGGVGGATGPFVLNASWYGISVVATTADNTTPDSVLTLREAMLVHRDGNTSSGELGRTLTAGESTFLLRVAICACTATPDLIYFSPSTFLPFSPSVILLGSSLPNMSTGNGDVVTGIGAGVVIDGQGLNFNCLTLSGHNNRIEGLHLRNCDGGGLPAAILVTGTNNLVGGSTIPAQRNVFHQNYAGIKLAGSGNRAIGNYIGILADGITASANEVGVQLLGSGNWVGGSAAGEGNVISGNTFPGIYAFQSGDNTIQGNYIGTNAAGTAAVPNGLNGITLDSSLGNLIGGTVPGARNVISGNSAAGVYITEPAPSAFPTGIPPFGFATSTLTISAGSQVADVNVTLDISYPTVGDLSISLRSPAGTVIDLSSNNGESGADYSNTTFDDEAATSITAGSPPFAGSYRPEVLLSAFDDQAPGGTWTLEIQNNGFNGGMLNSWSLAVTRAGVANTVAGNYIGINATGTNVLGNGEGVRIVGSKDNLIGGNTPAARNLILGNGVGVYINGANGNSITGNYIGYGIDGLNGNFYGLIVEGSGNKIGGVGAGEANIIAFSYFDGVFVTGSASLGNQVRGNSIHSNGSKGIENYDGGNGEIPPPAITATGSASGTASCSSAPCVVDVYSDLADEGRIYHGSAPVNGGTWSFGGTVWGPNVTAAITDALGNTSEFSAPFVCTDGDADGVYCSDNCPSVSNSNQLDFDADGQGDLCDLEADGDGFTNAAEAAIGTGTLDPCGNDGWPADLQANNRLDIGDMNSFLFPLRGDGSFAKFDHPVPDPEDATIARWNLEVNGTINIGDLNALNPAVTAATSRPPMFGGQPAFFTDVGNGVGGCPFPP